MRLVIKILTIFELGYLTTQQFTICLTFDLLSSLRIVYNTNIKLVTTYTFKISNSPKDVICSK